MTPTSWPLKVVRTVLLERKRPGLGDWKRIHVGAERDDEPGARREERHHAMTADVVVDFDAE